jgi:tetratricopeptide (TPR) repeat protein
MARLERIIEYSEEKDIPLLTPYLALANLFANAGRDADSIGIYENAARHFRDDPRIYAGLGAGHYYLGEYDRSVHFYSICLDLINASTLENHLRQGVMIANNLLQSMLAKGNLEGYIERVDKIPKDKDSLYRIEVLRGKYFMYQRHFEEARAAFEDVLNWLVTNDEAPTVWDAAYYSVMILDLANVYGELGRAGEKARVLNQAVLLVECRWKLSADTDLKIRLAEIMRTLGETYIHVFGMEDTGLDWYERAVGVSNHIRFSADLALQCRNLHSPRLTNALARCKARIDEFRNPKNKEKASPEDQYYFGLYYYLNGEYEKARVNYRESGMSQWPAYERLVR